MKYDINIWKLQKPSYSIMLKSEDNVQVPCKDIFQWHFIYGLLTLNLVNALTF